MNPMGFIESIWLNKPKVGIYDMSQPTYYSDQYLMMLLAALSPTE